MQIIGKTDTGKKRSHNQDNFFAGKIGDVFLAVVCDGVGGAKGGDIASKTAIDSFVESVKTPAEDSCEYKDILWAAAARANNQIYKKTKENKELYGMSTTVVACIIKDDKLHIINVGDSRLYVYNSADNKLTQLTKDHSLVQSLVDAGEISKLEAATHPNKNVITRALGAESEVDIDYYELKLNGDRVILCSDGLYDFVNHESIINILKENPDAEKCAEHLVKRANENGGGDNITVVVYTTKTEFLFNEQL